MTLIPDRDRMAAGARRPCSPPSSRQGGFPSENEVSGETESVSDDVSTASADVGSPSVVDPDPALSMDAGPASIENADSPSPANDGSPSNVDVDSPSSANSSLPAKPSPLTYADSTPPTDTGSSAKPASLTNTDSSASVAPAIDDPSGVSARSRPADDLEDEESRLAEAKRKLHLLDEQQREAMRVRDAEYEAERAIHDAEFDASYQRGLAEDQANRERADQERAISESARVRTQAEELEAAQRRERQMEIERLREMMEGFGRSPADGAASVDHAASTASHEAGEAHVPPLFTPESWSDLSRIMPEITDSFESLSTLTAQLRSFQRPMGSEEAVLAVTGIESLNRVIESLSVAALSVFERIGTPTDFGAKSTKALIEDRLQISEREARRRVSLAQDLGGRVDMSGQAMEPKFTLVSTGLSSGSLSSVQSEVITRLLSTMPARLGADVITGAESVLVRFAPTVRVSDIPVLFQEIMDCVDPDGQLPSDTVNRSKYSVTLRALANGDWKLKGLLDPVTGGVIQGLLTSRIKAESETVSVPDAAADSACGEDEGLDSSDSSSSAARQPDDPERQSDQAVDFDDTDDSKGQADDPDDPDGPADQTGNSDDPDDEVVELYDSVLRGDLSDAIDAIAWDEHLVRNDSNFLNSAKEDVDELMASGKGISSDYGVREDGSLAAMYLQQPSVRERIYERFATLVSRIEMDRVIAGAPFALVVTAKAEDIANGTGRAVTGSESEFPIAVAAKEGLNSSVFFQLMSEKTRTVSVSTEKRFANAKQLAILTARDRGCTFPGCSTPPGWCDVHHIVPWSEGGKTDINNLTLACGSHHHLIDRSDWYAVMLKNGNPAWVPPATLDLARRPVVHARFIARGIPETLFD